MFYYLCWDQFLLLFILPLEWLPVRSHVKTETIALLLNSYRVHCLLNAIWSGFSAPESQLQHPSSLFKNRFYGSRICYWNKKELWGPERTHQPPREAAVLPGEHLTPPPFPLLPCTFPGAASSLKGNSIPKLSLVPYLCCKAVLLPDFHQVNNSEAPTHQCHCNTALTPLLQMFHQLTWTASLLALLWMGSVLGRNYLKTSKSSTYTDQKGDAGTS